MGKLLLSALASLAIAPAAIGLAGAEPRDSRIVYNSIPKPLPGNVASAGAEALAFRELGDGVVPAPGAGGTIDHVTVVMSSWGCTAGHWFSSDCVTSPKNAKFSLPITLDIYAVIDVAGVPTQGALLATQTKTFEIPYRPSSDPAKCGGDGQVWFSQRDNVCYHGLAHEIDFDLDSKVMVPDRMIVGISYNTSHYGPVPIGQSTPCFTSSGGCPYDSLNISADGSGGLIGSVIDPNGIFVNYAIPSQYCQPHVYTGNVMQLDNSNGCWTGFHPQIRIVAETREKAKKDKDDPRD
jgi:hypothetical protein